MLDASASPKHRINSAKALDALAANGPESVPASDRFIIQINIGDVTERYSRSISINPDDIDPYNNKPNDTDDTDPTPPGVVARGNRNKQKRERRQWRACLKG